MTNDKTTAGRGNQATQPRHINQAPSEASAMATTRGSDKSMAATTVSKSQASS